MHTAEAQAPPRHAAFRFCLDYSLICISDQPIENNALTIAVLSSLMAQPDVVSRA